MTPVSTQEAVATPDDTEAALSPEAVETPEVRPAPPQPPQPPRSLVRTVGRAFFAAARTGKNWLVGAVLCMNYATAVLVVGWVYGWMRTAVVRSWWKRSRFAREGTFRQFCAAPPAGLADPRPKWHRVWANMKTGFLGLFNTYLLTGWGCLLMLAGWEYGWLNSFHKGYELSAIGVTTSLIGIGLLIAALYYVLLAQAHQAFTGDRRAFFEFRFVWRLVRLRTLSCLGLMALVVLLTFPVVVFQSAVVLGDGFVGNQADLTDQEVLAGALWYMFRCTLFLIFPALLLVRWVAARVYAGAVVAGLRQGSFTRAELHPTLRAWLDALDVDTSAPPPKPAGFFHFVFSAARFLYRAAVLVLLLPLIVPLGVWALLDGTVSDWRRRLDSFGRWLDRHPAYLLTFVVLFLFVFLKYVGEFLVWHPVTGFMNFELIQIPAFDVIPVHLWASAAQQ